jgi:hypothetical protein
VRLGKVHAAGICVLLLGGVVLAACGSQQSGTTSGASAGLKASAPVSAREAAKRYFAAMTPVIERDYKGSREFSAAGAQWGRKYANGGATGWTPIQELASILMRFEPLEQQVLSGYEGIDVPPAFRKAHAALLADNTAGLAYADELIHDINTQRPPQQWLPGFMKHAKEGKVLDRRVVRDFRKAAAKLHLRLPVKLLKTYSG